MFGTREQVDPSATWSARRPAGRQQRTRRLHDVTHCDAIDRLPTDGLVDARRWGSGDPL